jgi:stalled ribosome alternative rescue factor ArfA
MSAVVRSAEVEEREMGDGSKRRRKKKATETGFEPAPSKRS